MSLNAYQKIQNAVQSPRDTEYRLFAQVTQALIAASGKGNAHPDMVKALDWNRRLWSVLSSDCGAAGNGLPKPLRAQIISLSLFVSRFSSAVIKGEDTADTLIEINRNIMEGLAARARPAAVPEAATAAPSPGLCQDA
jgi:flagellar protein FlaF